MKEKCKKAARAAAGRELTQQELQGIEDRIKRNMRKLAAADRDAWRSKTEDQQWREAAQAAAEELKQEAIKKKVRTALTIQAHDRIKNYADSQQAQYGFSALNSLDRLLDNYHDDKNNVESLARRQRSLHQDLMRRFVEALETTQPETFGLFANQEGQRAFTYEMMGKDSRQITDAKTAALAKAGIKQWNETAEIAHTLWNNAGGDTGQVEDWRRPQGWSQHYARMGGKSRKGKANPQQHFVDNYLPMLNRERYVKEDGSLMNDTELTDLLKASWETVVTGGANKDEPGAQKGIGMMANRHAAHRTIHLKDDPDGYLALQEEFGEQDVYTAMLSHVKIMARDIAALEKFGPNAQLQFRYQLEKAVKETKLALLTKPPQGFRLWPQLDSERIDAKATEMQNLFNYLTGRTQPVGGMAVRLFDISVNWMVSTKLGSAFLSSMTDNATIHATAALNNVPHVRLARDQLRYFNPKNKTDVRIARSAGLMLDVFSDSMNRWGTDALGGGFSHKMAGLTMKLSMLNHVTSSRRAAFSAGLFDTVGHLVQAHDSLAKLDPDDHRILLSKGFTEQDWQVWRLAKSEQWRGGKQTMLTPESIYRIPNDALKQAGIPLSARRESVMKLLSYIGEEADMAVVVPSARIKSKIAHAGVLGRAIGLFKTFALSMAARHWTRGMNVPIAGGKAKYIASLMAGSFVLGMLQTYTRGVITQGEDAPKINGKFVLKSLASSGGLGAYGDFLIAETNRSDNTLLSYLGGPLASTAEDAINLTVGNAIQFAKGKKTNFVPEAANFLKKNMPLQNLWYTALPVNRMFFNQLQEMAVPGYGRRVDARARKEFGSKKWWPTGKALPTRAPQLAPATGGR